jgi:hypothetical protein
MSGMISKDPNFTPMNEQQLAKWTPRRPQMFTCSSLNSWTPRSFHSHPHQSSQDRARERWQETLNQFSSEPKCTSCWLYQSHRKQIREYLLQPRTWAGTKDHDSRKLRRIGTEKGIRDELTCRGRDSPRHAVPTGPSIDGGARRGGGGPGRCRGGKGACGCLVPLERH